MHHRPRRLWKMTNLIYQKSSGYFTLPIENLYEALKDHILYASDMLKPYK